MSGVTFRDRVRTIVYGIPLVIAVGVAIESTTAYLAYLEANDGRHEIDFTHGRQHPWVTTRGPGRLVFTPNKHPQPQVPKASQRYSYDNRLRIVSTSKGRRLVRDMSRSQIVSELQNLSLQNATEESFNTQHARTWLDYFSEAGHDFATLYAWASRYTHMLEQSHDKDNSFISRLIPVSQSISILKLADPSHFNRALTNINNDVEPYGAWIKEDRLMHLKEPEDWLSHFNRAMAAQLGNEAGPYATWIPGISRRHSLEHRSRYEFPAKPEGSPGSIIPHSEQVFKQTAKHWVIHPLRIFPRRIWDLHSNRVIPFDWLVTWNHSDMRDADKVDADSPWGWRSRIVKYNSVQAAGLTIAPFAALSHSWATTEDRTQVWTEINQYQWPVPFPKDASLDDLRAELLRMGLRYCWLDVLCLRQAYDPKVDLDDLRAQISAKLYTGTIWKGIRRWMPQRRMGAQYEQWLVMKEQELTSSEHLRKLEWKVDVPTIGNIYHRAAQIVVYLNGLGRPLDWNWERDMQRNSRHWFRRAWTLQELGGKGPEDKAAFLGGTGKRRVIRDRRASRSMPDDASEASRLTDLGNSLSDLRHKVCTGGITAIIEEMNKRDATNQTDKVCGMIYLLLESDYCGMPVYDEEEPMEALWHRCVQMLLAQIGQTRGNSTDVSDLLMRFPHPSSQHWYPSWNQLCHYPETSIREPETHDLPSEYSIELHLRDIKDSLRDPMMLRHCIIKRITDTTAGDSKDRDKSADTWNYHVTWKTWTWLGPRIKGQERTDSWLKLHLNKETFVEPLPDGDYALIGVNRFREKNAPKGTRPVGSSERFTVLLCKEPPNRNGWFGLIYMRKVAIVEATWGLPRKRKYRSPRKAYFEPGPWRRAVLL